MELKPLLKDMIDAKASDIFVVAGLPLSYEANGSIYNLGTDMLRPADTPTTTRTSRLPSAAWAASAPTCSASAARCLPSFA